MIYRYKALPTDVRSFMEDNRKKAKSIFTHDIGPIPTRTKTDATATGQHDKGSKSSAAAASASATGKKSSEADSLRVFGAGCAALFGAFGIAALLL